MKVFKVFFRVVLILIFLIIIGAVFLVVLVNPNHFKPIVSNQVQKITGKTLTFNGDLSWKFWPSFGFGFDQVVFGSEKQFNNLPLIQIDHGLIGIKLKPLFSKKIIVDELFLKRLTVNFIKSKQHITNWQTLKVLSKDSTTQPKTTEQVSKASIPDFELNIPAIYTHHIRVNWLNLGNSAKSVFQAQNFKASVKGDPNLIEIKPVRSNLYGGNFSGNVIINLKNKILKSHTVFNEINIQSFLNDLAGYQKISGTGSLSCDLTLRNFNFNNNQAIVNFSLKNGTIKFLNIVRLIEIGQAIRQGKQIVLRNLGDLGQTQFGDLVGNAVILNNFVTIRSIQLSSDQIESQGNGTLDLNTFKANIHINAWLKGDKNNAIPIVISGDIRHPSVRPDQTALLKKVLAHQQKRIKKVLDKNLGKALNKLFG